MRTPFMLLEKLKELINMLGESKLSTDCFKKNYACDSR